jgi:hypothetical protein
VPFPPAPDAGWDETFAAIDAAFADATRPEHFTNIEHCCECADEDAFFQGHTPESLAEQLYPETIGLAFLTQDAFAYFLPALVRMLPRSFPHYCVGDVLFHVENRLDTLTPTQRAAIRDLLYLTYEKKKAEIDASPFDYEQIWRMLNDLDATA